MKILFTYPSPFNPMYGGIERVTDILARELSNRGHKIFYLHHRNPELYENYKPPFPYFFVPTTNYTDKTNHIFYHQFLEENKIDIIINQCGNFGDSSLYLSIGNNSNIKTISVLHGDPLLNHKNLNEDILILRSHKMIEYFKLIARFVLYKKIRQTLWRNRITHFSDLFKKTDIVCLLSDKFIPDLSKVHPDNNGKIVSIPNPCSYTPLEKISKKKNQLLYVGRLERGEKRPDRLISIWRSLYRDFPNWELVIVGDGKERRSLESKAKHLPRIKFTGYQDPSQIYEESKILLMTSNHEGFGMVLIEAMALGCIPFAFNSFAAAEDIIRDSENGFLITPFSLDEYSNKLSMLMSTPELQERMANNCLNSAKKWSVAIIADKWENLLNKLTE